MTAILALLIGVPLAFYLTRTRMPAAAAVLDKLAVSPLMIPSIITAVDAVLTSAGLPPAQVMNPGTTCPPTKDGNSLYNPPYVEADFPPSPGSAPRLYICYESTAGLDPHSAAPQQKDLEVIELYKYSLITGFMQGQLGPGIDETAYYHGRIP